jgi:hypothetical protein
MHHYCFLSVLKLPGKCLEDRENFAEEAVPGEERS